MFDWVRERSKCCLSTVFNNLAEVLDSDVKTVNALGRKGVRFETTRPQPSKLIVVRERDFTGIIETDSVVFELTASRITAVQRNGAGNPKSLFSASPNLTAEGNCVLEIDGTSLRLWQVSRLALEDLFFGF